jgi:hypothetical protein
VLSRFTDATGTLIGTALASTTSATVSTVYEHGIKKSAERARRIRESRRYQPGDFTQVFGPVRKQKHDIPWRRITVVAASMLVACLGIATGVDLAAAKPLAVTGGVVHPNQPPATVPPYTPQPAPTYQTYTSAPTDTPSPSPAPSMSPSMSPSPSSPAASPTPTPAPTGTTG